MTLACNRLLIPPTETPTLDELTGAAGAVAAIAGAKFGICVRIKRENG